jgi:hypothetical protein
MGKKGLKFTPARRNLIVALKLNHALPRYFAGDLPPAVVEHPVHGFLVGFVKTLIGINLGELDNGLVLLELHIHVPHFMSDVLFGRNASRSLLGPSLAA